MVDLLWVEGAFKRLRSLGEIDVGGLEFVRAKIAQQDLAVAFRLYHFNGLGRSMYP
jgi:hypothetical protein